MTGTYTTRYTAEEQKYIESIVMLSALVGAPCDIKNEEEFYKWADEKLEARKREELKKEERKIKKAEKEARTAEEKGMTVEEYREYKKVVANAKRHRTEAENLKKELAELKKRIAYHERKAEEIEATL